MLLLSYAYVTIFVSSLCFVAIKKALRNELFVRE